MHSVLLNHGDLPPLLNVDPAATDYVPKRDDVVISLTTVPSRLATLGAVLRSLQTQSVRGVPIELHLGRSVRSTGQNWEAIPRELSSLRSVSPVIHGIDCGPGLKFLPALRKGAYRLVIIADDDVLYPSDLVERLLDADSRWNGRAAICYRGWKITRDLSWERSVLTVPSDDEDLPVGILTAHGAYALRSHHVDLGHLADMDRAPEDCRMMDDVWLSAHLSMKGTPKRLISGSPRFKIPIDSTLGGSRESRNDAALRWFAACWREDDLEDRISQ